MDWIKIFKEEKELSSLQLENSDITYQVWELGNLLAHYSGYYSRILSFPKDKIIEEDLFSRIEASQTLLDSYVHLSNKLSSLTIKVLSDQSEYFISIYEYFENLKQSQAIKAVNVIRDRIADWHEKISHELQSHSIHLANIYLFSFTLESLREKLAYDIYSVDIEPLIDECVKNLNNLEKGDKILTSPNLRITERNLLIMKYRLKEIKSQIRGLRELSKKNKDTFTEMMQEKAVLLEYLILDLRNPSDYISGGRKMINIFVPFTVIYYIIIIPIIMFPDNITVTQAELFKLLPFISPFVPLYIYVLWKIFKIIKNKMIIRSFKLKIDRLN